MTPAQLIVVGSGLLLFVLGLLNGLIIAISKSPRLSLSAHLTAVQSGTFLIAVAWVLPFLEIDPSWSEFMAWSLGGPLMILWLGLCLAGVWGAGRGLPIAGEGQTTGNTRQLLVTTLIGLGTVGTTLSCCILLYVFIIRLF
jgi:(hydroxyamino)benzene mutase